MRVGTVTEIKPDERRVGLTPSLVHELVSRGHEVLVQAGAGDGAGIQDAAFYNAGATLVSDAYTVWDECELLVKVKEPVGSELDLLRPGLTLFSYLHLAPNPGLTKAILDSGATAIAFETVEDDHGALPLLAPMSEIAGRLAAQAAAHHLLAPHGGRGQLIGGSAGVPPASVIVLGGGTAGTQAALVAAGMGARVTILERAPARIRRLCELLGSRATVLLSDRSTLAKALEGSDAVIGAVLSAGALAPKLVDRPLLRTLEPGAVVVDVAVDQGGCFETSKPTTHHDPVYEVDGVLHYCVSNMPGAVPVTATRALGIAIAPYLLRLASLGIEAALEDDCALAKGLNVRAGEIFSTPVASAYAAAAGTGSNTEHQGAA